MFLKSAKNRLVILIKNNTLVFCEGNFDGSDIKINKLFRRRVGFNIYEKGMITDEIRLAEEIKFALNENNVKTKKAYTYIMGTDVIKKTLIVPYIEDEEDFDDLVHAEISQVLPIELDDFVIKYKFISEDKRDNSHKVKLNCAILSKQILESYKNILQMVGLTPLVLDIDISSIQNLIKYIIMSNSDSPGFFKKNIEGETFAIIEIGMCSCSITIYKDGLLDFDRIIKRPPLTDEMADEIISVNNINEIKNEEIFEILNDVLSEINLVLKYYSNRDRGNIVNQIFLYGEAGRIDEFDNYIQDVLQITTNSINSLKNIYDNKIEDEHISLYVDAIGGLVRW